MHSLLQNESRTQIHSYADNSTAFVSFRDGSRSAFTFTRMDQGHPYLLYRIGSHLSTARGWFRAHIPIKGKSMSGYFSLSKGWVQGPCPKACQKSWVHFIEIVNVDYPFFSLYSTVRAYQSLQFVCQSHPVWGLDCKDLTFTMWFVLNCRLSGSPVSHPQNVYRKITYIRSRLCLNHRFRRGRLLVCENCWCCPSEYNSVFVESESLCTNSAGNSLHHRVAITTFWCTFLHDGKMSKAYWELGCTPTTFHYIYHHVQSCGVSWENRYLFLL